MPVNTDKKRIDEVLSRGVVDLIDREHLRKRMEAGEKLRIKFGIDPTSPHIHLGHTVPLRKLRQFQDLGHQAVLIIGDATAMIGDPTGRSEERKRLDLKTIKVNQKTYLKQAGKILDLKKVEVHHNGDWFHKMRADEFLGLTSLVTVQQILQREDFRKRVDDPEHPLSAIELTYPIMQGYDSVMVKADVEIGGHDQLLNLHMGRRMQRKFGQVEQDILTVSLIEGTDGTRKMSKSYGNAIALEEKPEEMYGKAMTIADGVLVKYFELLTGLPRIEIDAIKDELATGTNPRDVKMRLAHELVRLYHSKKDADKAAEAFVATFQKHEVPEDMPEHRVSGATKIIDLLVDVKFASSNGEAKRLIDGGGVKVAGEVAQSYDVMVHPTAEGVVVQKGKRHFVRVVKG